MSGPTNARPHQIEFQYLEPPQAMREAIGKRALRYPIFSEKRFPLFGIMR